MFRLGRDAWLLGGLSVESQPVGFDAVIPRERCELAWQDSLRRSETPAYAAVRMLPAR